MLPSTEEFESLPRFTAESPLRLFVSACLAGERCGVDGTTNGEYPWIHKLLRLPNVKLAYFCPEQFSFGTPRNLPDIHGGDGFDVLDGKVRVITDKGEDWTAGMIAGAQEMLRQARAHGTQLALLMDMSAACGSQVISDGCRLEKDRKYRQGPGVCAAMLMRDGIRVLSQRDFRSLELLYAKLDPSHVVKPDALDHHETKWFREYFAGPVRSGHP